MYVMIPTYPCSLSSSSSPSPSPMRIIDLNVEDQSHELIFSPTHQPSSSSSSLSYPIFVPSQDHAGSSFWESKTLQTDHDEAGKNIIASSGSWNDPEEKGTVEIRKKSLKLRVWKRGTEREDENNYQGEDIDDDSVKWMPSKMRMMRKMMASDQKASDDMINTPSPVLPVGTSRHNSEDQNQDQHQLPPSLVSPPPGTDNSSSSNNSSPRSNNNNNITVRVCADCHTTKTPLWRSGPRGPKSLCNACGIRQRKARRAMVAATANGSGDPAGEKSAMKGSYKFHNKEKKSRMEYCERTPMMKKKKHKLEDEGKPASSRGSRIVNKFSFEDFTVSLSKNLAAASKVFPQDEKEAAILLMALSCNGLVHG